MIEHVPSIDEYTQKLNTYLAEHYPAYKKITSSDWNALFLMLVNQGNLQEETLARICNVVLTGHVEAINNLVDATNSLNSTVDIINHGALRVNNITEGSYIDLNVEGNNINISAKAGDIVYDSLDIGETQTGLPGTDASVTKTRVGNKTLLNFTIPSGEPGSTAIKEYSSLKSYELGETFLYNNKYGITLVAHDAETFTPEHNAILANQIQQNYDDYEDLYQTKTYLDSTKFNKSDVKNTFTNSIEETYTANYINKSFAPIAFTQPYFAVRQNSNTALLSLTAPESSTDNILTSTVSNRSSYNWNTPDFILIRQLNTTIELTKTNSLTVTLPFRTYQNCTISWGAKVKISTDNGVTWTYISTAHAYGAEAFSIGSGNTSTFTVSFDELNTSATYEAGTLIAIEIYRKLDTDSENQVDVYCGVLVDGAIIHTVVQLATANVFIDTTQLQDKAVTYDKLADDTINTLHSYTDTELLTKQNKLTAGANIQIIADNEITTIISATDTTYPNLPAVQNGYAASLVYTGDKYYWNNKAEKTISQIYTLAEADWTTVGGKPKYILQNISGKTATNHARVSPAQYWTGASSDDVYNNLVAISDAKIYEVTETVGYPDVLTFTAKNKPNVDIKILLEVYE